MKKILLGFMIAVLMISSCASTANAGYIMKKNNHVHVRMEEIDACYSVTDDFYVFTMDMDASDEVFKKNGTTKKDKEEWMSTYNMYMEANSKDGSTSIQVISVENSGANFDTLTEADLMGYLDAHYAWVYEESGCEYLDCEVISTDQTKFFKTKYKFYNFGMDLYSINYFTVMNGKEYDVRVISYVGDFDVLSELAYDLLIYGFHIGDGCESCTELATADMFKYRTHRTYDSRATFPVMDKWKLQYETEAAATFHGGLDNEKIMEYTIKDVTNMYSYKESVQPWNRLLTLRRDLDFDDVSKKVFAEALKCSENKARLVRMGERDYYCFEDSYNTVTAGREKVVNLVKAAYVQNGYVHTFTFYGASEDIAYLAFEKTLKDAEFYDLEEDLQIPIHMIVILSVIFFAAIVSIIIRTVIRIKRMKRWISKKKEKKENKEDKEN